MFGEISAFSVSCAAAALSVMLGAGTGERRGMGGPTFHLWCVDSEFTGSLGLRTCDGAIVLVKLHRASRLANGGFQTLSCWRDIRYREFRCMGMCIRCWLATCTS
jgi:hypothetical protein